MSIAEKLITIAENEQKVYEAGKTAEYDSFWDGLQNYGKRAGYNDCFKNWGSETISPKYTITAGQLYQFINGCTNLVTFDWGKVVPPAGGYVSCYAIANGDSKLVSVDTDIIFSTSAGAAAGQFMFANCTSLARIQKIYSTAKAQYTNAFQNCTSLVEIRFEGVIGEDINFQWSPLSKESIESVISRLSDSASGKTATVKKTAILTGFETSEGAADGSTSEEWLTLVASKPNWTVSLV